MPIAPDELDLLTLPATPDSLQDWALGPASNFEVRLRTLSARAAILVSSSAALALEAGQGASGLSARGVSASGRVQAVEGYLSSPDALWMRSVSRLADYSGLDSALSRGIQVLPHEGAGLAPLSEEEAVPALLKVVRGTGIPGDNMELTAADGPLSSLSPAQGSTRALASPGSEPQVSFQPDPRTDLAVALVDDSRFFDWERLYVPQTQKCSQRGTAYVFDGARGSATQVLSVTHNYGWKATVGGETGVPLAVFARPTDALSLVLEMDLGTAVPVSHLDVSVRQAGGLWPTIDGVSVSADGAAFFQLRCGGKTSWTGNASVLLSSVSTPDSQGNTPAVATGQDAVGVSTWVVPMEGADLPALRYVQIALSQPDFYECPKGIGHPYYVKVTETVKQSSSWFGLSHSNSDTIDTLRLNGPEPLIGVQTGEASVVKKQGGGILSQAGALLDNPALKANPTLLAVGAGLQILGSIWGSSSTTLKTLQAGEYADVFDGLRQCISIRRLKAVERVFASGTPGQMVTGEINFGHPFSAVRLRVDDQSPGNTAIAYDVSFDGGRTWTSLTPTDLALPGSQGVALSLLTPQKTARLRATFSTSDPHATPRLYGYSLEALPALS